ncbi:MAG: hypothetical protein IJE01_01490 [Clostridia bacterium]|nr:hypothetical protein [Clostridia bacterium]
MLKEYLKSIADVIRQGLNTTATINAQDFPSQIGYAFEKQVSDGINIGVGMGKEEENTRMWDIFQCNGERDYYEYAFTRTNATYISPKHIVAPTSRVIHMFSNSPNLESIDGDKFDFSNISVTADASSGGYYNTFYNCPKLKIVPDINMPAGGMYYTFSGCASLETIELVRYNADCVIKQAYTGCYALKNITIEGEIGNNVDFSPCTLLTHESLMSIINHLKDFSGTGTTRTLTIGTTNQAKLKDSEKSIATEKGWTLA